MSSPQTNRIAKSIFAAVVFVALVGLPWLASSYLTSVAFSIFLYVVLAYSWNFISGYTGYISFGQIAMFGIGGYIAALFMHDFQVYWLWAAIIGAFGTAIIAIPLGYIMLRLKGPYFAVGMLGLFQFVAAVAASWKSLTKGTDGIYLKPVLSLTPIYYAFLGMVLLLFLITLWLERSKFGMRLKSLKDDEVAAESVGINTTFYAVFAFTISAFGCALAGGVQVYYLSYIDPTTIFDPSLNLLMIIMVLLGGRGTLWGPLIGAVVLGVLSELLWANFPYIYSIIYGVVMALIVTFMPEGLVGYFNGHRLFDNRRPGNMLPSHDIGGTAP